MKLKRFILESNHINRDSYIWNMAGSLLAAFQSVILLIVLTRTVGLHEAGIFTIAFANANLFMTIGKYGMRNYQVSDLTQQFSFHEYRASRLITCLAMLTVSAAYVTYSSLAYSYSPEKSMIILWMCIFKVLDAVEDVYGALCQQKNRLDITSKAMTLRVLFTLLVYILGLILMENQLHALVAATLFSTALLFLFSRWTYSPFREPKRKVNRTLLMKLLKSCFPLFLAAFLSFYIGNAPKYAIDANLSDELQACYGFISMPIFIISLLNSFIFNPILYHISCLWNDGKITAFIIKILRQTGIIVIITLICLAGGYLLGIPVLSFLYNTDLSPYKTELLILLLGGGFLGISGFLTTILTIIRSQKALIWGYAGVSLLAYLCSDIIVKSFGMMGAAVLYMLLMCILCIWFVLLLAVRIQRSFKKAV